MTTGSDRAKLEDALIHSTIVRLRSRVMALVFGMVGGTALWLATVILLVQPGDEIGPHLGLLNAYFPGYTVTWSGAFVGFGYGAVSGAVVGWSVAWVYNQIVDMRHPL